MKVTFEPYRNVKYHHPTNPKGRPMPDESPDLAPLRLQLQTVHRLFCIAEVQHTTIDRQTIMPLLHWQNLAIALNDLAVCARRTL